MPDADVRLPKRYATVSVLGRGGGGEVRAVRDRLTGEMLALKVLAEEAGEQEVMALVREASALSGLEGLGVPRVVAFGTLEGSKRRYLVREIVDGDSLAARFESRYGEFLGPLAHAAEQLTVLHRAGLLHGDVKPANIIVGHDGLSTLVDLGLAAPWREGGSRPRGLTPRYAAPELFAGAPLTVRAEVYALGATLAEALLARGDALPGRVKEKLEAIAKRASEENPQLRHPSVDEFSQELRRAADLPPAAEELAAWPVLGLDAAAQSLIESVKALEACAELFVTGPVGSGKSTLLRRVAWTLGAAEVPVFHLELGKDADEDAVVEEIESAAARSGVVVVDGALPPRAENALLQAKAQGARVVRAEYTAPADAQAFAVPRLADAVSRELVRRAVPSLSDALADDLVNRAEGRPGILRRLVKRLRGRTVVSVADLDAALSGPGSVPPSAGRRSMAERFALLSRALDTGRFDEAETWLAQIGAGNDAMSRTMVGLAKARLWLARGAAPAAESALAAIAGDVEVTGLTREADLLRARVANRSGDFERAATITEALLAGASPKTERASLVADALASRGVALAFMGQDVAARKTLEEAVLAAKASGDDRVLGVAWGSLAIGHQRSGHNALAREAYENALVSAEAASDAWTMVTTRLNLASLAQSEGDLVRAIAHLEAAVDLGTRAGGLGAVRQARLNLGSLDLYLGRYARARTAFETLRGQEKELSANQAAHLLSMRAQLAANTGAVSEGSALYEEAAGAYDVLGRPLDAAEARLERLLTLAREGREAPVELAGELGRIEAGLGGGAGFGEHEPVAALVRGLLAQLAGDEAAAQRGFDLAISSAEKSGRREWQWRALDARAKLGAQQGSHAHARRDTEAALSILEEIASKLPRDLREVFWDDPRRRALREAHTATMPFTLPVPARSAPFAGVRGSSRTSTIAGMPAEDRLALIFEITRELAREHDMERLLVKVTDQAVALSSADRGLVLLVGEDGTLAVHTARDRRGEEEAHSSFSRSVAQKVVETGEPVVATSAKDDELLAKAVSVHQLMIQSVACVPIRGAPPIGRPIGALYLETRLRPGVRFKDELATLAAFADQAAIAIENARLLGELRAREGELQQTNKELEQAKEKLAGLLGRRTEQLAATRRDLKVARAELRSHFGYHGLVGTSEAMRRLYALLERVKDADVPVLVTGESGTGKEMVAKAVHTAGVRGKAPFIGVNCGAIPENLLESELFGHKRGAFTGAERDKKGLFQEAVGGTILLDEIGEMPLKMQAGLLRVLQERTVRPVGAAHEEPVDVRVLAATNRDLTDMVARGTFREDLYYRLNVVQVTIPPLRERAEDIVPLADHFLTLFAARYRREKKALSRAAAKRIADFDWPGNVRQLEHVLLNAWLMSEADEIEVDDISLPTSTVRARSAQAPQGIGASATDADLPRTREAFKDAEKGKILEALERAGWNRVQAAKLVGIPRRTFYRRLKDYGIV